MKTLRLFLLFIIFNSVSSAPFVHLLLAYFFNFCFSFFGECCPSFCFLLCHSPPPQNGLWLPVNLVLLLLFWHCHPRLLLLTQQTETTGEVFLTFFCCCFCFKNIRGVKSSCRPTAGCLRKKKSTAGIQDNPTWNPARKHTTIKCPALAKTDLVI